MRARILLLTLPFLTAIQTVSAKLYETSLENSEWALQSSPFECRLTHPIPAFGSAVLEKGAGSPMRFWFAPMQQAQTLGLMRVYNEPPVWMSGQGAELVATLNNPTPLSRIEVSTDQAPKLLAGLEKGLRPTLRVESEQRLGDSLVVGASPANFTTAYQAYLGCVAQLLPVNYDQIARTAILYPPSQWELSDSSRERLKVIQQYVATDSAVIKVYVDGHSDASGRRLINRDLSKKRAEAVFDYLVKLGMNKDMLVTRYHGERYPVVPNTSAENRTRNRRVTIRLERTE